MNDEWQWWALALGILLGIGAYWLVRERLTRREEDLWSAEREHEAEWISRTIDPSGRRLPPETVESVLELHREYLAERTPPPSWGASEPARADVLVAATAEVEPVAPASATEAEAAAAAQAGEPRPAAPQARDPA